MAKIETLKKLEVGDRVHLYFTDRSIKTARLIRIPAGPGDLWQFEDLYKHTVFAQNPYAKTLECIERVEEQSNG